jgi:hypothetical protein
LPDEEKSKTVDDRSNVLPPKFVRISTDEEEEENILSVEKDFVFLK